MKRLTVHVSNAEFVTSQDKKTGKLKQKIKNTLAFKISKDSQAIDICEDLTRQGMVVTKQYQSNIR